MPRQPSDSIVFSRERRGRMLCALFFVCLLLLGWFTTPGYGVPWDETDEMNILRMNLWEYGIFLGMNVSGFEAWAADPAFEDALLDRPVPISQSVEQDHGACAYYPLAGAMMKNGLSPESLTRLWRLYTWTLFWLGTAALYFVCRHLGLSQVMACMGAAMLLLVPRFFAEGHYNNKDIVLMSLVLLTLWQSLRLAKKPRVDTALLFALAGAAAANTKIIGLFVFGLCGIFAAARLWAQGRLNRKTVGIGAIALCGFLGFYFLLTPALWREPLVFLKHALSNASGFTRWHGYVLFRGAVFDTSTQPLPWYYLPYMMLVTTPLWIWLFFAAGQGLALVRIFSPRRSPRERLSLLLCTLLWALPLGAGLLLRPNLYNGWRHFYFLFGPMLALAALGISWLWEHTRTSPRKRRMTQGLLALCAGVCVLSSAMNHPYQYAFYNALVPLEGVNARMERDYWNVSVVNALKALEESGALETLEAPAWVKGVDLWSQAGVEHALSTIANADKLRATGTEDEAPSFYLVNHTYQNFSGWQPEPGMTLCVRAEAYGSPLVTIYQAAPEGEGSVTP